MEGISTEGFVRFAAGPAGAVVVSRAAVKLHTYAVVVSIKDGHPGRIEDAYLDAIQVETSLPSLELCLVGLWERVDGGYRVTEDESVRVARVVQEQLIALAQRTLEH